MLHIRLIEIKKYSDKIITQNGSAVIFSLANEKVSKCNC